MSKIHNRINDRPGLYASLPQGNSRGAAREFFNTDQNDYMYQRPNLNVPQEEQPNDVFIHQTGAEAQNLGPHDTLLSQYKKCSRINNEQLRNARNLEQLVGIKVHAIDGRLGTSGQAAGRLVDGGGEIVGQPTYDFKFDPLHFRQKVPCMADRSFLINQAILSSSTQMPRLGFQGQNAARRMGTASTGTSFGPGSYPDPKMSPPFSGASTRQRDLPAQSVHFGSQVAKSVRADERLFSSGFDATTHGGAGTAGTQGMFGADFKAQNGVLTTPGTGHETNVSGRQKRGKQGGDATDQAAGSHTQADSRQGDSNEGHDSPTDPINALKSIFKPKVRAKRAPVELNPVMNKYRQRHHTTSQKIRSMRNGVATASRQGQNQFRTGKVYKEDMLPFVNAGGEAVMSSQTNRLQEYSSQVLTPPYQGEIGSRPDEFGKQSYEAQQDELGQQRYNPLKPIQNAESGSLGYTGLRQSHPVQQQQLGQYQNTRQQAVKEKLENLRKLFAEEDINETVKGIQHDWELEDQKIAENKPGMFKQNFNSTQPYPRQAVNGVLDQDEDVSGNDLRGYLTRKIKQIQDRSDPHNIDNDLSQDRNRPDASQGQASQPLTFKASTLTHIAELRGIGQEKIENQFIERLFREQTDYHFERYAHGKQKAFSKQAADHKNRTVHQPTGLIPDNNVLNANADLSRTSQSQNEFQSQKTKSRGKQRKPVNIVQEQMLKIERINRESENRNRALQQEVRNTEIYDIIRDTQDEMSRMRQDQNLDGTIAGDMAEIGAQSSQDAAPNLLPVDDSNNFQLDPQRGIEPFSQNQDQSNLFGMQKEDQQMDDQQTVPIQIDQQMVPDIDAENQQNAAAEQSTIKAQGDKVPSGGASPGKKANQPAAPEEYTNKTITSKVNIHSVMNGDMKDVQNDSNQFRVSQLVQAYNAENQRTESPQAEPLYLSDTELFMSTTRNYLRGRLSPQSRGGGFKDRKPRQGGAGPQAGTMGKIGEEREAKFRANRTGAQRRSLGQIDEEPLDITHGNSFSYFCPKRFNRYPRFTIFFKRDRAAMSNQYVMENTVSLSPQFLSYLMDKNGANLRSASIPQEAAPQGASLDNQNQSLAQEKVAAEMDKGSDLLPPRSNEQQPGAQQNLEYLQTEGAAGPRPAGEEAVTGWNQKNEMVQNYDPFEKVVLVKGIDNSILTSFRTLKRENNTVSDTFKIVHQKFLPSKHKGLYFKSIKKNQADKLTLYPHTDNEDALDVAHAELLAESLLHQVDDAGMMHEEQQRQFDVGQIPSEHHQRQRTGSGGDRQGRPVHQPPTGANSAIKTDRQNDQLLMQQTPAKSEVLDLGATNQAQKQNLNAKHPVGKIRANVVTQRANAQGAPQQQLDGTSPRTDNNEIGARGEGAKVSVSNYLSNAEPSNASFLRSQKMQPQLFKATTDSCNDINLKGQMPHQLANQGQNEPGVGKNMSEKEDLGKNVNYGDQMRGINNRNQFKHQIEVMVLSKVDPLDSAFPGAPNISESNLSNSFLQAAPSNILVGSKQGLLNTTKAGAGPIYQYQGMNPQSNKRNPFKNGPLQGGQQPMNDKANQPGAGVQNPGARAVTGPRSGKGRSAAGGSKQQIPLASKALKNLAGVPQDDATSSMNQVYCKRGHRMVFTYEKPEIYYKYDSIGCDECNKYFKPNKREGVGMYHCEICEWKYCVNCSKKHQIADQDPMSAIQDMQTDPGTLNQTQQQIVDLRALNGMQKQSSKPDKRSGKSKKQSDKDSSKYGKDFKIPELPPILQERLFGEENLTDGENISQAQTSQWFSAGTGGNNQYKIKKFIDDIYQKEMKYRYHRQYVREDFLLTQSPIFNLKKSWHLRPKGDLLSKGINQKLKQKPKADQAYKGNEFGMPVLNSESESLTNVLGFQAGGPHVVVPIQPNMPNYYTNQQRADDQGDSTVPQSLGFQGGGGGVYNANQIYFGTGADSGVVGGQSNAASALQSTATRKGRNGNKDQKVEDEECVDGDLISPPDNDQDAMLTPAGDEPASDILQPQSSAKVIKSSDR